MSDADRVQVSIEKESTFATAPTGSNYQEMRLTSDSLQQATTTVQSQEIRSDRQVADIIRTDISASGDLGVELSFSTYDELIAAALQHANAAFEADPGDVDTADTGISVSSGQFVHATSWAREPAVGEWIKVSGFTTNAGNNGYFKVAAKSSTTITPENAAGLVDESAGDSVTIAGSGYADNGTDLETFTIVKQFQDLSNIFALYKGMGVNGWSLEAAVGAILTGTFSFLGSKEESAASHPGTGVDTATTTSVMNSIDHIKVILEGAATFNATQFSLSLENNLRARQQLGTLGAISLGSGQIGLSGSLQSYLADSSLIDKYLNFTTSSLAVAIEDGAGNGMVVELPSVKYTNGARVAGGLNQDVIADMQWSAFKDATDARMIRVARFAA